MKTKQTLLGAILLVLSAGAFAQSTKTYIVQLTDAPAATYDGSIAGLAATRAPAGSRFSAGTPAVRQYLSHLARRRAAVLAKVGAAPVVHTYSVAYAGFAAKLTDAQAMSLRLQPGVASVVPSKLVKMATTQTPDFLGLSKPGGLWSKTDASAFPVKGENVIVGVIDSGIWPEDPAFSDKVDSGGKPVPYFGSGTSAYGPPPAKWRGTCQIGEGFTAAMCNNKLIGARWYVDDYVASGNVLDSMEYRSARGSSSGGGGHGTHTASTAAGNERVDAILDGVGAGQRSGMAPRARVAVYKACWEAAPGQGQSSCASADLVKAIDDAVSDGVDVISYSISGTGTDLGDPQETAFFNASAAGVFVAAAAANAGPANSVVHPSPWLTTVAASSHDRYIVAQVRLGNGAVLSGPSFQRSGVPNTALILASDAGVQPFDQLSAVDQTALQRCYSPEDRQTAGASAAAALDPAKTAGRIVVCFRGGNYLISKALTLRSVGAAGMILLNTPTSDNAVYSSSYAVPSVHLDASNYEAVTTYARSKSPVASFSPGVQQANVVAPVMAAFSSRGPNRVDDDILKPEITAPGVDIIAGWTDSTLTQAQHDALILNSFVPKANTFSTQGTSMSTPHIAGLAALVKQLHPTWSPAAIKSALMTTAKPVLLADGQVDPDRWGYGAGHVSPNAAADPGLVYDIAQVDYARYLCGRSLQPPPGSGDCQSLLPLPGYNLNLASLTAGKVLGSLTLQRTVKNVSSATSTYVSSVELPGWTVTVSPATLTLAPGQSATFSVTLAPGEAAAAANQWSFGKLVWSDGTHTVTSPLSARPAAFAMPSKVVDKRSAGRGTKVFQVTPNYTGAVSAESLGLMPSIASPLVLGNPTGQCWIASVPEGTKVMAFGMFQSEIVSATGSIPDFGLLIADADVNIVAVSNTRGTSDELVNLNNPAPGDYIVCAIAPAGGVEGFQVTLHKWMFSPDASLQPLRAVAPTRAYTGKPAAVSVGWDVPAGRRYLGGVTLRNPQSQAVGTSLILVDNQ